MQKLVSIIVPVYNVEKYIDKCVRSLLKQDYGNIEVILVDDGSPDKSGYIIDRLKEEDNRIVVIHQENHGVSSARNAGMAVASGEYITFVDGDDWVDANYVTYFVDLLEKSSCDVVMNKNNYPKAGLQRLFQKGADNFVLLHKNGKAVAFQSDQNGNVNIVDRQTDINSRLTGLSLLDDGWKCVGPGLQYSWLFE